MKNTDFIKKIIGDDSFGLIKGLSLDSRVADVKQVEKGGDCYESNSPLHNIQCFEKLFEDKDFTYKYVYFFEDLDQSISEINLFLEFDNDLDNNITFEEFEDIISDLKIHFTNKYGLSGTETDHSGEEIEYFFHFDVPSTSPVIEIVLVEYLEDDKESSIEKKLKVIWQKK